ncbi:MAG TPA: septum site-determining protein MinC [Bacillota bacterium]|nr:septum site-determining protein MinC [Bacillota bacterium]
MGEIPILIKGSKNGLNIYIDSRADIPVIREAYDKKLQSAKPFFSGTKVNLTFIGKEYNKDEQEEMIKTSARYMTLGEVMFFTEAPVNEDENNLKEAADQPTDYSYEYFEDIDEGMTKFIKGTVRSGQRIYYEGNIVVLGDINPGGELVAGGNIFILGTIRGMAHAGATGNTKAVVAAFWLLPSQLRIAGKIAMAPDGDMEKPQYPEIAYIRDKQLIIEPYLPRKG